MRQHLQPMLAREKEGGMEAKNNKRYAKRGARFCCCVQPRTTTPPPPPPASPPTRPIQHNLRFTSPTASYEPLGRRPHVLHLVLLGCAAIPPPTRPPPPSSSSSHAPTAHGNTSPSPMPGAAQRYRRGAPVSFVRTRTRESIVWPRPLSSSSWSNRPPTSSFVSIGRGRHRKWLPWWWWWWRWRRCAP
jgi:hypothetical protein